MTAGEIKPYPCCQPKAILVLRSSRLDGMFAVRADQIVDVFETRDQECTDKGGDPSEVGITTTSRSCFYTRSISFSDLLVAIGWAHPSPDTIP